MTLAAIAGEEMPPLQSFRLLGPDGLNKVFADERAAVAFALEWAGEDCEPVDTIDDLGILYTLLDETTTTTGEVFEIIPLPIHVVGLI